MHITYTVDTATNFGIDMETASTESEQLDEKFLWRNDLPGAQKFLDLLNACIKLTQVINEFSRRLGEPNNHLFVLPFKGVTKPQFIHDTVKTQGQLVKKTRT